MSKVFSIFESKSTYNSFVWETLKSVGYSESYIPWNNKFIRKEEKANKFELVCGMNEDGSIILDLAKYPHILISGMVHGKSILETCLAWQCIKKGAKLYMADLKGVEFTQYRKYGEVINDKKKAVEVLRQLSNEITLRCELFRQEGMRYLHDYNTKYYKTQLSRIVFVCDEVAEMFNVRSEEEKTEADEIIKYMNHITRIGRAPGVHLILVTSISDTSIIPDQVKGNMVVRISSKMPDNHTSQIAIGSTRAAELANIIGRFVYNIGLGPEVKEFQGFAFNSSYMDPGQYQVGRMLTDLKK